MVCVHRSGTLPHNELLLSLSAPWGGTSPQINAQPRLISLHLNLIRFFAGLPELQIPTTQEKARRPEGGPGKHEQQQLKYKLKHQQQPFKRWLARGGKS